MAVENEATSDAPRPAFDWRQRHIWIRGLLMIVYAIIWNIVELILGLLAIVHFVIVLGRGAPHPRLSRFGADLSKFVHDIAKFLTFASEARPFPFTDWPAAAAEPPQGPHSPQSQPPAGGEGAVAEPPSGRDGDGSAGFSESERS